MGESANSNKLEECDQTREIRRECKSELRFHLLSETTFLSKKGDTCLNVSFNDPRNDN